MKHYYDQRYSYCDTCHFFRESIIEGRYACGRYAMAFSPAKGIIDDNCEGHRTELQWDAEQKQRELMKRTRR